MTASADIHQSNIAGRFDEFLADLKASQKPTIANIIETLDRQETKIAASQRALVAASLRTQFHLGEMRDCLHVRCAIDVLTAVEQSEDEIRAVIRRADNNRWQRAAGVLRRA